MVAKELIQELRAVTGAGMMACKKALVEAKGDLEKAIVIMRKSGEMMASKRSSRVAAEGEIAIRISNNGKQAVIAEINCETDFVARDANFKSFVAQATETALAAQCVEVGALSQLVPAQGTETLEQIRVNLIAKVGENIQIRRLRWMVSPDQLGSYVHTGSRLGTIVAIQGGDADLAKDIAMHITAMNPLVVEAKDIDESLLAKERAVIEAQAKQGEERSAIATEHFINGRLKRFTKEMALVEHAFFKNSKQTVGELLKSRQATVLQFVRFELGEGLEKKTQDFRAEVEAQIQAQ